MGGRGGGDQRLDLSLRRMVEDAVVLGPSAGVDESAATVVAAGSGTAGPWLRDVPAGGVDAVYRRIVAEFGDVLHPTHGPNVVGVLLVRPPRHLAGDNTTTLLACFEADGDTSLAGMTLDAEFGVLDAYERRVLRPGLDPTDDVELRTVRDLAGVAAAHRLRPVDPVLRATLLVAAGADPGMTLAATGLVAGAAFETRTLPDPSDTKALNEFKAWMASRRHLPVVLWEPPGGLAWFYRWAKAESYDLVVVRSPGLADVQDETYEAIKGRAPAEPEESDDAFESVHVTLTKEGHRGGAVGDDLRLTDRTCVHKVSKRKNAKGAESKWKGAENVVGLPAEARLRSLKRCGTTDCSLVWATYRVPVGSGWPPPPGRAA